MGLDRRPTLGVWYTEDREGVIGQEFTYDDGRRYKFVKVAGGATYRDGENLEINVNTNVAKVSTAEFTDAIMVANNGLVNCFDIAATAYKYGLVQTGGKLIRGALTLDTLSTDESHMPLINDYITGVAATGNRRVGMSENAAAIKSIAGATANLNANATHLMMHAASSLFAQDLRVGDKVNGNTVAITGRVASIQSNTVCWMSSISIPNTAVASLSILERSPRTMNGIRMTGAGPVAYETQWQVPDCVVNVAADTNLQCQNANSYFSFRVGDIVNVISSNGTSEVRVVSTVNATSANTTNQITVNGAWSSIVSTATDYNHKIYIKGKRVPAIIYAL